MTRTIVMITLSLGHTAVLCVYRQMCSIVRDGAGCSVCLSVGLSVSRFICHNCKPCKMVEPIEIPFGFWTRMGPRKHALDGSPDPPIGTRNSEGERAAHCKV